MSEFAKTVLNFIVSMVLAVLFGMVLGDSVRVMFGTNEESLLVSIFEERMTLIKTDFAAESIDYQTTASALRGEAGLRVFRTQDGGAAVERDGVFYPLSDYFSDEPFYTREELDELIAAGNSEDELPTSELDSVTKLFAGSELLSGARDENGNPIDDVTLYNIAVTENQVFFYMYYHEAGFVALVYDLVSELSGRMDYIAVVKSETDPDQWGLLYQLE